MKKPAAILNVFISVFIIAAGLFFSNAVIGDQDKIVASNYSDRYHLSSCKVAQKIPPEELLIFATPEEALATDLVPCKKCNPPTSSRKKGDK